MTNRSLNEASGELETPTYILLETNGKSNTPPSVCSFPEKPLVHTPSPSTQPKQERVGQSSGRKARHLRNPSRLCLRTICSVSPPRTSVYIICRTSSGSLKKGGMARCTTSPTAWLEQDAVSSSLWCRFVRVKVLGLIFGSGVGSFDSIRLRAASRLWMDGLEGGDLERWNMRKMRRQGRRRRNRRASRLSFMVD